VNAKAACQSRASRDQNCSQLTGSKRRASATLIGIQTPGNAEALTFAITFGNACEQIDDWVDRRRTFLHLMAQRLTLSLDFLGLGLALFGLLENRRGKLFSAIWHSAAATLCVMIVFLEIQQMASGTVKWFNSQKGYGFIQPSGGGRDVFVHISAVERAGLSSLNVGQRVEFEIMENRGRTSAENLRVR